MFSFGRISNTTNTKSHRSLYECHFLYFPPSIVFSHGSTENILLPLCALFSPCSSQHMHMITDSEVFVQACVSRDLPQSLFNNTVPLWLRSVCVHVRLGVKNQAACACAGLCVNKCVKRNELVVHCFLTSL